MADLFNYFLTKFLLCIGYFSSKLSVKNRTSFGNKIGDLMRLAGSSRRQITMENIYNAFPEKHNEEKEKILKESYRNLGITLVELLVLKYLSAEEMKRYITYNNIELLESVFAKGKGVILLSGHFGNWEYLAYSAGLFTGIPITIIVNPQKNKYADKMLNEYRTKSGNSVVSMYSAARKIVQVLTSGSALALLADQSATEDKDLFVEFFGKPAATYEAPANLALKFGVPMVIGFAVRQKDCTYLVNLHEVKSDDLKYCKEDILELTKRHVKILEDVIREYPGLWSWQHRRWKHSPKTN